MIRNLWFALISMFLPKVETINVNLNEKIYVALDRNYLNYKITKHASDRMKDRKISLTQVDMALRYGNETDKGVELRITDIPEKDFTELSLPELKALTYLLPMTMILNKETKTLITLYPSNKTYLKDKIVADQRCSKFNNKYTRKIKGKLRDFEKLKHHKERKYKKFYLEEEND